MVYLRRLDFAPGIIAEGDQKADIDAQLAELAALREAGKIHSIAVSNVAAGRLSVTARGSLPRGVIEQYQKAHSHEQPTQRTAAAGGTSALAASSGVAPAPRSGAPTAGKRRLRPGPW